MGVKVIRSVWTKDDDSHEKTHVYENAHSWNIVNHGTDGRISLEVIGEDDEGNDRVVAQFNKYEIVEVIDEDD